ncbi:PadR family transcriptional regulator [Cryobacterium sp. TMS1-13-1]|nr:PadR family transcriptional regulator [Cryobacterium sp. TMS1-13-1]
MAVPQDAQSLRGVLPMLILSQLRLAESYGYELVVRLQNIGLEQEGSLTSRLVASTAGPARKYYSFSPAGEATLELATARWHALIAIVQTGLTATPAEEPLREDQK